MTRSVIAPSFGSGPGGPGDCSPGAPTDPDVGFQLRRFRFLLVISPSGEISLASDPSSQFVQPQRHGMVRPPEHALCFPDAPVQVVQGHLGLDALRLGPVNFRAASLNNAINSSVRTFIIPSPGPVLGSEITTEGSKTENSNHPETILRGFPKG